MDVNAERDGLLHVKDMGETFTPSAGDVVATKDTIFARVKFVDAVTGKLGLSLVEVRAWMCSCVVFVAEVVSSVPLVRCVRCYVCCDCCCVHCRYVVVVVVGGGGGGVLLSLPFVAKHSCCVAVFPRLPFLWMCKPEQTSRPCIPCVALLRLRTWTAGGDPTPPPPM